MDLSAEGAAFIARHEGKRNRPYNDALGHCTVGIGHLIHEGSCTAEEFRAVWTDEEIMRVFLEDIARFVDGVNRYVRVRLTQAQFDALVSFAFNWGVGEQTGFPATSVLALVNAGRFDEVPAELVHGRGPPSRQYPHGRPYDKGLAGVRARRIAEGELFSSGRSSMKFVSRDEAGLRAPRAGRATLAVETACAHYGGDGPGPMGHGECAATWRSWQRQHMDTDQLAPGGASDIAYNAGVCQHGYVFEGRGRGIRSAANGNGTANGTDFAICYIGGASAPFTAAAKQGFRDAAEWLGARLVRGHRDHVSTSCPGDEIYSWLHSGQPGGEEEEDMTPEQASQLRYVKDAFDELKGSISGLARGDEPGPDNWHKGLHQLTLTLRKLRDGGGGGGGGSVDTEALARRVADLLAERLRD